MTTDDWQNEGQIEAGEHTLWKRELDSEADMSNTALGFEWGLSNDDGDVFRINFNRNILTGDDNGKALVPLIDHGGNDSHTFTTTTAAIAMSLKWQWPLNVRGTLIEVKRYKQDRDR